MRTRYVLPVLTIATALALSGCVDNSEPAATGAASGSADAIEVKKNDSIAAMLPEKMKTAGVLNVGMANNYPPNEFKDDNGAPAGWAVDLTNALGQVMGLKVNFDIGTFDNILPAVKAGKDDMGISSFTDTLEREKQVDFVNYYSAGIQWAAPKGKTVDPDNACGLKVAVQATTYEDTHEVPAKSKACTDAGKPAITIFKYDAQDQATNALVVGQVDAMSADSPGDPLRDLQDQGQAADRRRRLRSGTVRDARGQGQRIYARPAEGPPVADRRRHLQQDPVQVGRGSRRSQDGGPQRGSQRVIADERAGIRPDD